MENYPQINSDKPEELAQILRRIARLREEDVSEQVNLPNRFISGRKVGKIPTASSDVDADSDRVGDFNYDASYIYVLVNNAGTAVWRRATLAGW